MKDMIPQLRKTSIFSEFTEDELHEVSQLLVEREYRRGSVIFNESEEAGYFYLIKSGRVKIYKLVEDGRELIIGIFSENGIFGDVPVFDGGPYPASAETMVDSTIWSISRNDFEILIKNHPDISLKLIRVLGKRLRQAHNLLRDMALKNVPQRLAKLLIKFEKEYGKVSGSEIFLDLPFSRQDIAEMIGVSRETVTRELSKFVKADILKVDGKKLTIVDDQKLKLWT